MFLDWLDLKSFNGFFVNFWECCKCYAFFLSINSRILQNIFTIDCCNCQNTSSFRFKSNKCVANVWHGSRMIWTQINVLNVFLALRFDDLCSWLSSSLRFFCECEHLRTKRTIQVILSFLFFPVRESQDPSHKFVAYQKIAFKNKIYPFP